MPLPALPPRQEPVTSSNVPTPPRGRESALHALLAGLDRAWNAGDAAAWAAAFTPDARLVTRHGTVCEGRAAIEAAGRRSLAGRQRGSHARTTVERVGFPAANVAVVDVVCTVVPHAFDAPASRARLRLMAVRPDGGDAWQLAALQSTPLPDPPDGPGLDPETTLV